jgi:predicted ATP-dependent endonuclease of OLD family
MVQTPGGGHGTSMRPPVAQNVSLRSLVGNQEGQCISPEYLSSGEKQLLLLFCNAITARKSGTIFIIDEPEISLNVKWQRKLIDALLACLRGVDSQIVLATHSIEILAKYERYVAPLIDISEGLE